MTISRRPTAHAANEAKKWAGPSSRSAQFRWSEVSNHTGTHFHPTAVFSKPVTPPKPGNVHNRDRPPRVELRPAASKVFSRTSLHKRSLAVTHNRYCIQNVNNRIDFGGSRPSGTPACCLQSLSNVSTQALARSYSAAPENQEILVLRICVHVSGG